MDNKIIGMEIRKWTTIDVHYNEYEQKLADKEQKRLEKLEYKLQERDVSGGKEYEFCDQYIKSGKTRIINH